MGILAKLNSRPVEAAKLVVVWCFAVLIAWFGEPQWKSPTFAAGLGLIVAGLAVRSWAAGHLQRNRELATSGPYAYLRDPLYLGRLLLLCGLGVMANRDVCYAMMAVGLLLFFVDYMPRKLRKETARLEKRFGEQYRAYHAAVRSLVPRLRPYEGRSRNRWSSALYWGENREQWFVLSSVLLVALMLRGWWLP